MSTEQHIKPISSLSFEQALQELEIIVRQLEEGRVDLDKAITFYERGNALKAHCEEKLKQAKMKVEQINLGQDGQAQVEGSDLQQVVQE